MCFPYCLLVLSLQYEKLVMTKDLQVKKVEFVAEGRKLALKEIRLKILKKTKEFMKVMPDEHYANLSDENVDARLEQLGESKSLADSSGEERRNKLMEMERTRHLLMWHDNSTVANHGHLVCMVSCLYDPAIFLTEEEYKLKTGKADVDIQKQVEEPEVHLIARCGSSDDEQLAYSETRLQCIQELKGGYPLERQAKIFQQ